MPSSPVPATHSESAHEQWIRDAVAGRWPAARAASVRILKGDASNRRFWRVLVAAAEQDTGASSRTAPESAIAIDLGPDDFPLYVRALDLVSERQTEPPFLNVQRFLKSIGVAVPEIYVSDTKARMLLVEDVGEMSLFEAALGASEPAALYRSAIDELLLIQVKGTRRLDSRCIAGSIVYSEKLFRWEMNEILDAGGLGVGRDIDTVALSAELDELAARLGGIERVLSHRDYHGNNLFLQDGRIRVIDFQDALLAPAAQDLAVLLTTRDTDRVIDPRAERRLLDYYLAGLARRGVARPDAARFIDSYYLCVLQHAIKVIGRFNTFERQGKSGYAAFIPHAAAQARRALAALSPSGFFPKLHAAFAAN